jgi:hypothetical protein
MNPHSAEIMTMCESAISSPSARGSTMEGSRVIPHLQKHLVHV